jgi:hypothetical protein
VVNEKWSQAYSTHPLGDSWWTGLGWDAWICDLEVAEITGDFSLKLPRYSIVFLQSDYNVERKYSVLLGKAL